MRLGTRRRTYLFDVLLYLAAVVLGYSVNGGDVARAILLPIGALLGLVLYHYVLFRREARKHGVADGPAS